MKDAILKMRLTREEKVFICQQAEAVGIPASAYVLGFQTNCVSFMVNYCDKVVCANIFGKMALTRQLLGLLLKSLGMRQQWQNKQPPVWPPGNGVHI